jgi:hypothetical protein
VPELSSMKTSDLITSLICVVVNARSAASDPSTVLAAEIP